MEAKIFFSYSHKDLTFLENLKKHLKPLQREKIISEFWYDRNINAGKEWEKEIDEHLNNSQIILLLVSPDFIASDYCYGKEVKKAIERHDQGEAIVIPVILRPASWENTLLGKLQALPSNAKPINDPSWNTHDKAYVKVAEGIRDAIQELSQKQPATELALSENTGNAAPTVESAKRPATEPALSENTGNAASAVESAKQPGSKAIAPKTPTDVFNTKSNQSSPSNSTVNQPTPPPAKKSELSEILKDYRERLAQMEASIDLGGYYTLTEHFADQLNRLLTDIISTIRTTNLPEYEFRKYFKSKEAMIDNIRQARIFLTIAMESLHPSTLTAWVAHNQNPIKPVAFYQNLNTCRRYLEKALNNW